MRSHQLKNIRKKWFFGEIWKQKEKNKDVIRVNGMPVELVQNNKTKDSFYTILTCKVTSNHSCQIYDVNQITRPDLHPEQQSTVHLLSTNVATQLLKRKLT